MVDEISERISLPFSLLGITKDVPYFEYPLFSVGNCQKSPIDKYPGLNTQMLQEGRLM